MFVGTFSLVSNFLGGFGSCIFVRVQDSAVVCLFGGKLVFYNLAALRSCGPGTSTAAHLVYSQFSEIVHDF